MTDIATFQRALDDLETGLDAGPDLAGIKRTGRRVHRRRLLVQTVGLAAAATTVVALGFGPATRVVRPSFLGAPTAVTSVGEGRYVSLGLPGWAAVSVYAGPSSSEVHYRDGAQELTITEYPASAYDSYYADRQDLGGQQGVDLLGQSATLWAYSADDHTVIRTPSNGRFIEVRGTGMEADAYASLLGRLSLTDRTGYMQSLPPGTVGPDNRDQAVPRLLQGVDAPVGFSAQDVPLTGFNDLYQASAQVATSVECAWLDVYDSGTAADRAAAVSAMESSRHWPLLVDIEGQGDYSRSFWETADALKQGAADQGAAFSTAGFRGNC